MIKSVRINDIPDDRKTVRAAQIKKDIEDFLTSQMEAAEVNTSCYKSVQSAAGSYAVVAKRVGGVRVIQRRGKLYLIRKKPDSAA